MVAKIIRRVDSKGRVMLPADLLEFLNIKIEEKVAICDWEEGDGVMIRNLNNIKDCKIVCIVQVDSQRRVCIPKEIMKEIKEVEIYVKNDSLILEEAH